MKRKLVRSLKPTMKIAQEGDRFEVEIEVPTKTTKNSFTIGEEFESEIALEQTGRVIIASTYLVYLILYVIKF